jgi:hypothetical protein
VAAVRTCVVTVSDLDKVTHTVEVQAETLFEAAAAAVAAFRQHSWGANALAATAVLRIEVQAPTVVHTVPLAALERWQRSPSTSPKELLAKRLKRQE